MRKVVKFGGSSLANAEQFEKVGDIIRSEESRRFVVPSAPGKRFDGDTKVTDLLYSCYDAAANGGDFEKVLESVLLEFPVKNIQFKLPEWMRILPEENAIISKIMEEVKKTNFEKMADYVKANEMMKESDDLLCPTVESINLSCGNIDFEINATANLFYKTLSEITNTTIANDYDLISFVEDASVAKMKYSKQIH